MHEISFVVDGLKLQGTIFYPENIQTKKPVILFVHGWMSKRKKSFQYAQALARLGFICFLFDMRGHGESEGDIKAFTVRDFLRDVIAAYDYVITIDNFDKENISAIGSSFGGYLLSLLSEKKKITNLSLRVPADYPNESFDQSKYDASGENPEIMKWRNTVQRTSDSYALEAIHKFSGNLQIIESENDTVVPHQTIQNYINSITNKKKLSHVVLKDAPHSLPEGYFRDQVERILVDWFKDKV